MHPSSREAASTYMTLACLWWLAGTAVQVSTQSKAQLIVGRVLNGVCVGITSSQVPVYLAEIAKKEKRGSIIVIQQLAIEIGILIMYFIGYGCSFIPGPTASFRTAWAIQWVPCVILLVGLPFLPRSPRWLAKVGRTEEAVMILANIQAGGDQSDPRVIAEWEEITTVLAAEREAPPGWRRFVQNGMWRRTFAGFSVQAWQQLSGANVMTYYLTCECALYPVDSCFRAKGSISKRRLLHGRSVRRRGPHIGWCPVRGVHRVYQSDIPIHRQ